MGGLTVDVIRKAREILKAAPKPDWLVMIDGKEYVNLELAMGGVSIATMQVYQLVDSDIASTRRYWRKDVWGFSDEVADDPRPLKDVLGSWPDWRTGNVEKQAQAEAASEAQAGVLSMSCEGCTKPAEVVLSYLRTTQRAGTERIERPLCAEHGRQVWNALAAPLKDTAIIAPVANA